MRPSRKLTAGLLLSGAVWVCGAFINIGKSSLSNIQAGNTYVFAALPADSVLSKKAFLQAYAVLMSPRCMNCHPAGDAPLQGEDSHIHTQGVLRGKDGNGMYALKCSNCHQPKNVPGPGQPPGNPKWKLPPAETKMVFQGKSPRELAAQMLDPKTNGGKSKAELIDHVTNDTLVAAGWHPGQGHALPPLSHTAFAKVFKEWIDKGSYLPD